MSSCARSVARVLRNPSTVRALSEYLTWQDILALLNTCRKARTAFLHHPEAVLETFVPAFNRLLPPSHKDRDQGVRVDVEQWVFFMLSISEPLAQYPALALSLLTKEAQSGLQLMGTSDTSLDEQLRLDAVQVSAADDARANRLEQLALAHTRMVLLMRSRAPPLSSAELDDPPFRPTLPSARTPDEPEITIPAPLAYFDDSSAASASVTVGTPSAPIQLSTANSSKSSSSSSSVQKRSRQSVESSHSRSPSTNRFSKMFGSGQKAPPPAPQRDKRMWFPAGGSSDTGHELGRRMSTYNDRSLRMSRHAHSASDGGGSIRTSRVSLYGSPRPTLDFGNSPLGAFGALDRGFDVNSHSPHSIYLASSRARALVLRLFVPCATLDEDTIKECEEQLQEEGLWQHVRPGDVLCNIGHVPETPEGPDVNSSDAGAWLIVDKTRHLRVWHPHTPPPLDPATLLNVLSTPFFYAHISAPPQNSGSNTPTPMPLSTRGSIYSLNASASSPSLHHPTPFFAQLAHRRPGSAGSATGIRPPSAWGGVPMPSRHTSSGRVGAPPGQDPRYHIALPPLPTILSHLGIPSSPTPGSDIPGVSWLLSPQTHWVPLRPKERFPGEQADRARVKRWVWLAIIDLRRGKGAPVWPSVTSAGHSPAGGVPPVPPLPGWVPKRPKIPTAGSGSTSSSNETSATLSPNLTPSTSSTALTSLLSHSLPAVESNGMVAPGWMREWILEAEGTVEGRRSLENVLRARFGAYPSSANNKSAPKVVDTGVREWEVVRERCGVGRVWMRLVLPTVKKKPTDIGSPHEKLAMSSHIAPRAPGQGLPRIDFRTPAGDHGDFSQQAKGALRDVHPRGPPPSHHHHRRDPEHGQRVASQPANAHAPRHSDPRQYGPWDNSVGSSPQSNTDWQDMQRRIVSETVPPHQQKHQHRLSKQPPKSTESSSAPRHAHHQHAVPRISLDSAPTHPHHAGTRQQGGYHPNLPEIAQFNPISVDPQQTPLPRQQQGPEDQWLQNNQLFTDSPIGVWSKHSSLLGTPSPGHSGSSAAPSLRSEASRTSMSSDQHSSSGAAPSPRASRERVPPESSAASSGSVYSVAESTATHQATSAPPQSDIMPPLPNFLANHTRPVNDESSLPAARISLPQSPELLQANAPFSHLPSQHTSIAASSRVTSPPPQIQSTSPPVPSPLRASFDGSRTRLPMPAVEEARPTASPSSPTPPPPPSKSSVPSTTQARERRSLPPIPHGAPMPHVSQHHPAMHAGYGHLPNGGQVPMYGAYAAQPANVYAPPASRSPPPRPTQSPPLQHMPARHSTSVFSASTGLVPPPPPEKSKSSSRKLTRRKAAPTMIPGH
ncbi:hypothetical protein BKA62DRAFT_227364 [Auriculariales sp. MPI-PUGE-AT-0066]|nr:hypothetical protein BKA62DRAFT_227364 [Auriculariales sp. MPI-PUGE-AT-0066]